MEEEGKKENMEGYDEENEGRRGKGREGGRGGGREGWRKGVRKGGRGERKE